MILKYHCFPYHWLMNNVFGKQCAYFAIAVVVVRYVYFIFAILFGGKKCYSLNINELTVYACW